MAEATSNDSSETGWTGGQYSIVRAAIGLWMFGVFAQLIPSASDLAGRASAEDVQSAGRVLGLPNPFTYVGPGGAYGLVGLGMLLAVFLAAGKSDRVAAALLWCLWDAVYAAAPDLVGPAMPRTGWVLLVHLCIPPAPYGSLAAVGRVDPRGGWRMSKAAYVASWLLLGGGYFVAGGLWALQLRQLLAEGASVLERDALLLAAPAALGLLFGPLAAVRQLRPWAWLGGLVFQAIGIGLMDQPEMRLGLAAAHLLTFDPAWIPPAGRGAVEHLFYDGHCGLCHRFVRLILSEDASGAFRLAPLDSDAFRREVSEAERASLPDSTVVKTVDGRLLTRSAGVLHVLARLGGMWRVASWIGRLVPRSLADAGYALVASVRRRLFAQPAGACPILPPDLRARFDY